MFPNQKRFVLITNLVQKLQNVTKHASITSKKQKQPPFTIFISLFFVTFYFPPPLFLFSTFPRECYRPWFHNNNHSLLSNLARIWQAKDHARLRAFRLSLCDERRATKKPTLIFTEESLILPRISTTDIIMHIIITLGS